MDGIEFYDRMAGRSRQDQVAGTHDTARMQIDDNPASHGTASRVLRISSEGVTNPKESTGTIAFNQQQRK